MSDPVRASPPEPVLPPPNIFSRSWKEAPRGLPVAVSCSLVGEEEDSHEDEDEDRDGEEEDCWGVWCCCVAAALRLLPRALPLMAMVVVLVMSRPPLSLSEPRGLSEICTADDASDDADDDDADDDDDDDDEEGAGACVLVPLLDWKFLGRLSVHRLRVGELRDAGVLEPALTGEVAGEGGGVMIGDSGEASGEVALLVHTRGELTGEPGCEVRGDTLGESVGDDEMASGDEARGECAVGSKCCLWPLDADVSSEGDDVRSGGFFEPWW